ncbi:type II secretion system F family protein [Streptomyces sp. NPDC050560]|uniref:type II secretion system F family protein n=1 Tax=Streptomyces sp. NPDC050560 TaxID=3365630 RepID=UPI0037B57F43
MSQEVIHRLGAALCAAAGTLWLLDAVAGLRGERRLRDRCAAVTGSSPPGTRRTPAPRKDRRASAGRAGVRRWLPVVGAVCLGYVLVGGVAGALVGALAGAVALRGRRGGTPTADAADVARAGRELPLAADLLAACITAGADPVTAAGVVGDSLGGPVGEGLARGAAELRLGGAPGDAWRRLAALPGAGRLAVLLERAADSGAPAAASVARLAAEARAERGRLALARARRAGVLVAAPVGLCFLPSFIAVGVVPVVIGLAHRLLGGGP